MKKKNNVLHFMGCVYILHTAVFLSVLLFAVTGYNNSNILLWEESNMKFVKCVKTGNIISGAAFFLLGIILMLFPELSLLTLSYAAGIILVISGIIRLLGYFSNDLYSLAFQFDFALGIFSIIFGVVFIIHPSHLISAIETIIGIFILINGLFALQTAMDSKKFGMKFWWIILVFSLFCSIFGIVLIAMPFRSAAVITEFLGASVILIGVEKIFLSIYTIVVKKTNKNIISKSNHFFEEGRNI